MPSIHLPRPWKLPEHLVTPESVYLDRRRFLAGLGLAGGGLLLAGCSRGDSAQAGGSGKETARAPGGSAPSDYAGAPGLDLYPAKRSDLYRVERPLTREENTGRYCNFYEFTSNKDVYRFVKDYKPYPWTLEVTGECDKPRRWDLDQLVREFGLEERVYRHRCVEAWSMVVPWTGFPFAKLIQASQPRSEARYVRVKSVLRPDELPGQATQTWYTWPYYEGLRLDEAMNELAFFTVGLYGHPLPKQNGAPWRLVLPWKYGYKGAKAIVEIAFVREQPHTFWNDSQPQEYGFHSNVNPSRPHPRWSQASERVLDTGDRIPTRLYNGYEAQVAALYPDEDPV
jgi:sulfoxide reductase catalytic subunit YedY